jgi:putative membrane protein
MRTTLRRLALIGAAGAGIALTAAGVAGASTTAAPNAQDRAFLVAAHQSNLAEIAAGKAAQQKATTSVVREHGQIFIRDHTRLDASLQAKAKTLGVTLPNAPSAAQRAQLAAVTAKSGAAFDTAWLNQQLASHRATLALGNTELATGSDPTAKGVATASAPVVKAHLAMLEQATGTSPTGVNAGTGGQAASTSGGIRTGWVLLGLGLVAAAGSLTLMRPRRATSS